MIETILEKIEKVYGEHTSLVSLSISGGSSYDKVLKMINNEILTANNIKSRV